MGVKIYKINAQNKLENISISTSKARKNIIDLNISLVGVKGIFNRHAYV